MRAYAQLCNSEYCTFGERDRQACRRRNCRCRGRTESRAFAHLTEYNEASHRVNHYASLCCRESCAKRTDAPLHRWCAPDNGMCDKFLLCGSPIEHSSHITLNMDTRAAALNLRARANHETDVYINVQNVVVQPSTIALDRAYKYTARRHRRCPETAPATAPRRLTDNSHSISAILWWCSGRLPA